MSYLGLTKRIINDELSERELMDCLDIPNAPVIQHTILKVVQHNIRNEKVRQKLIEFSEFMDMRFKILGLCKIGHLAIYALKKLEYFKEYQELYTKLETEDKDLVDMLDQAL